MYLENGFDFNTLRPRQDGRHFADDIFKYIFLNENASISIKISLKFIPKGPIDNIPALVQIMAWRRLGDKPLYEPMMVSLLTHICVTRPQWVKPIWKAGKWSPLINNHEVPSPTYFDDVIMESTQCVDRSILLWESGFFFQVKLKIDILINSSEIGHRWVPRNPVDDKTVDSGKGLVPSGNKPLPEPVLTQIYMCLWVKAGTFHTV